MKKRAFNVIIILLVIFITGCNNNDIEITRNECEPNKNQICYYDKNNNNKCFDTDLCLHVIHNSKKIDINDALKKELITINDLETKYNEFKTKLKNDMKIVFSEKGSEFAMTGVLYTFYEDSEYKYKKDDRYKEEYVLYDNQQLDFETALNLKLITIDELINEGVFIVKEEK